MNYAAIDINALTWLLPELKESLTKARGYLSRLHREQDQNLLKHAKSAIHEASGALQIMDAKGLVQFAQSIEGAIGHMLLDQSSHRIDDLDLIDDACNALITYFEEVQHSPVSRQPVVLYAYYEALNQLQSTPRFHPADLYFPPLSARLTLPTVLNAFEQNDLKRVRRQFEHHLLPVLKDRAQPRDFENLYHLVGQIALTQTTHQTYSFWIASQNVIGLLWDGAENNYLLTLDFKRWIARLNLQLSRWVSGSPHIAERLYREALFFIAHALAQESHPIAERLKDSIQELDNTFKLKASVPESLHTKPYRRVDQNVLQELKQHLISVKIYLNDAIAHEAAVDGVAIPKALLSTRFLQARKQLSKVQDSLEPLNMPVLSRLNEVLLAGLEKSAESEPVLSTQLGTEAASAVLLLEQNLEMASHAPTHDIQKRIAYWIQIAGLEPDLAIIESTDNGSIDLAYGYDQSASTQTFGREISGLLSSIEKWIDDFFRKPAQKAVLEQTLAPFTQLEGALMIAELPAALSTVQALKNQVVRFIQETKPPDVEQFMPLAEQFGRLSLLIDRYSKDPQAARAQFYFDVSTNRLQEKQFVSNALIDENGIDAPFESVEVLAAARVNQANALLVALKNTPQNASTLDALKVSLLQLQDDAELIEDHGMQRAASQHLESIEDGQVHPIALPAVGSLTADTATLLLNLPQMAPFPEITVEAFNTEMLHTFLEEAKSVLRELPAQMLILNQAADDQGALMHIRRAFHTLKGSGRMVGLNDLGLAAWAIEKRLNDFIAGQLPVHQTSLSVLMEVHADFEQWIEDLMQNRVSSHSSDAFEQKMLRFQEPDTSPPITASLPAVEVEVAVPTEVFEPKQSLAMHLSSVDIEKILSEQLLGGGSEAVVEPNEAMESTIVSTALVTTTNSVPEVDPPLTNPLDLPKRPRISLVTDNTGKLPADFAVKITVPSARLVSPPSAVRPSNTMVVIGPISLPKPLFNIYITETTEYLNKLGQDIELYGLEPSKGVSYEAYRYAHSLKGGAATVGFAALRDVASELEALLNISHKSNLPLSGGDIECVRISIDALNEMLMAFSNGIYPVADLELTNNLARRQKTLNALHQSKPDIENDLAAVPDAGPIVDIAFVPAQTLAPIVIEPVLTEANPDLVQVEPELKSQIFENHSAVGAIDDFSTKLVAFTLNLPTHASPQNTSTLVQGITQQGVVKKSLLSADLTVPDVTVPSELVDIASNAPSSIQKVGLTAIDLDSGTTVRAVVNPELVSIRAADLPLGPIEQDDLTDQEIDELISAHEDEIAEEILPDFVLEADELLPDCAKALISLELGAPVQEQLKRDLHTLKGAARMTGAMRFGALIHSIETQLTDFEVSNNPVILNQAHLRVLRYFDRAHQLYEQAVGRTPAFVEQAVPLESPAVIVEQGSQVEQSLPTSIQSQLHEPVVSVDLEHMSETFSEPVVDLIIQKSLPQIVINANSEGERLASHASSITDQTKAVQTPPNATLTPILVASSTTGSLGLALSKPKPSAISSMVRLKTDTLDRLLNQAGEVSTSRARMDSHIVILRQSLRDLTDNVDRLRTQLREVEIQAESQMGARLNVSVGPTDNFDPLEFDRFTRFQELTRMLAESLADMESLRDGVAKTLNEAETDLSNQAKTSRDMTQALMRSRLVQFDEMSDRLFRTVRLAARDLGKQVGLDIQGSNLEIDRSIVERMTPALEHLVRNCVSHGIESPQIRLEKGKSAQGKITITARQAGNEIELLVGDDGAGLDFELIAQKAIAKGLLAADVTATKAQLAEMIFLPNFSTADRITELSGRGVGMDVVRAEAASLGGRVSVVFANNDMPGAKPALGTQFMIRLPLTLAVNQVLVVTVLGRKYAIPAVLIESLLAVPREEFLRAKQSQKIDRLGSSYPFAYLGRLLELADHEASEPTNSVHVLLINSSNQKIAVYFDSVVGNQEVVVKNIGTMLSRIPGIHSAAVLGAGDICLILDPSQLWLRQSAYHNVFASVASLPQQSNDRSAASAPPDGGGPQTLPLTRKIAMVVDDSLTVRKVTERFLQRENWQVVLAKDGVDALEQLQGLTPNIMLVDVEMPRMDGFDLTRNVRADDRLKRVPIIMITSRTAEKHRDYALQLGVNAYFGKPYHEQALLEEIHKLTVNVQ